MPESFSFRMRKTPAFYNEILQMNFQTNSEVRQTGIRRKILIR